MDYEEFLDKQFLLGGKRKKKQVVVSEIIFFSEDCGHKMEP